MQRLATALVLLPALWLLIKRAPGWAFFVFTLGMITVGCWEVYRMLQARGQRPFQWLGLLAACLLLWSSVAVRPAFEAGLALVALTFLAFVLAMATRPGPEQMLEAVSSTLFPVLLVGLPLGYLTALRYMPGEDGPDLLMLLFICVAAADTCAYYVGKSLGRRPLAPRLSPKKTWEGAVAGLAGSVAAAWVAQAWFYQRLGLRHALLLGLILGAAGILGDLAESVVKRASGVKDASGLLPGHGGVIDRTDSLLFSGPILYYYYVTFLQAGS
ncbi:MAG: phosphatidate cytidylyltransferase [Candidatus Eiseniibacteriota bacterium]|jgi:phosphatidate cytidylyltransferase